MSNLSCWIFLHFYVQNHSFLIWICDICEPRSCCFFAIAVTQQTKKNFIQGFSILSVPPYSRRSGNRENTGTDSKDSSLESGVEAAWSGLAGVFTLKQGEKNTLKASLTRKRCFRFNFCLGLGKSSDCKAPWGSDAYALLLLVPTRRPETFATRFDSNQKKKNIALFSKTFFFQMINIKSIIFPLHWLRLLVY